MRNPNKEPSTLKQYNYFPWTRNEMKHTPCMSQCAYLLNITFIGFAEPVLVCSILFLFFLTLSSNLYITIQKQKNPIKIKTKKYEKNPIQMKPIKLKPKQIRKKKKAHFFLCFLGFIQIAAKDISEFWVFVVVFSFFSSSKSRLSIEIISFFFTDFSFFFFHVVFVLGFVVEVGVVFEVGVVVVYLLDWEMWSSFDGFYDYSVLIRFGEERRDFEWRRIRRRGVKRGEWVEDMKLLPLEWQGRAAAQAKHLFLSDLRSFEHRRRRLESWKDTILVQVK